jgi:hypothetical protein
MIRLQVLMLVAVMQVGIVRMLHRFGYLPDEGRYYTRDRAFEATLAGLSVGQPQLISNLTRVPQERLRHLSTCYPPIFELDNRTRGKRTPL